MEDTGKLSVDLSGMIPQLTEEIALQLRTKALESFSWEVRSAVQAEIKKYITENIVPTIGKELEAQHVTIRATFLAAILEGVNTVAEKLAATIKSQVAGYDGDTMVTDFIKTILGKRY